MALLDQKSTLHHFPELHLPIIRYDDNGYIVKNLKNEEECLTPQDKPRFDDKTKTAYIELSGTLEDYKFTLVLPPPAI
ncbi:MAG: hypothetical protein V1928_05260 [Parcubacteria group bacterium]